MKTNILVAFLVIVLLAACRKERYTTTPQLKFKSVSTQVMQKTQPLSFALEVTDAEGDIQDTIFIQKLVPRCTNSNFTLKYQMPTGYAPRKNLKGDITFCLALSGNLGCPIMPGPACPRNDTATFRFWVKDLAGNTSDTVTSPQIVIPR